MAKLFGFISLLAMVAWGAAEAPRKAFNPFAAPKANGCVDLKCDVRPADGVKMSPTRSISSVFEEGRQGCCSHHSGVCGCTSGRAVCCDGSLSPSCGCD